MNIDTDDDTDEENHDVHRDRDTDDSFRMTDE